MSKNYKAKETVLTITIGFLLVFICCRVGIFLYLALGVGLMGVFSFYLSERIDWAWTKLSYLLGSISNFVLLTIVFFLIVTPVALIRRMRKKNSLTYFDPARGSNFSDHPHDFTREGLEKTW